ncbi:MAG: hypothetical protein LBH16_09240 [Treponema sp.]|jgi:hypothetical protein|nr:hypothetical protein [Treponema sp.]
MEAADVIAICAIILTLFVTIIQYIFESKREWHTACELLFQNINSFYTEVMELVKMPDITNHLSYQHLIYIRLNLLSHYEKRFYFHKNCIMKASNLIIYSLLEILLNADYEELLNKGFKNKKKQNACYLNFANEIRTLTKKSSEALIK